RCYDSGLPLPDRTPPMRRQPSMHLFPAVALRVIPAVVLAFLGIWAVFYVGFREVAEDQTTARLEAEASAVAHAVASTLTATRRSGAATRAREAVMTVLEMPGSS